MGTVKYLGYTITPNMTGYVKYDFYSNDCDALVNHGESIQDCKNHINFVICEQIIELIKTRILEYNEPNGSMVQFEIDGFAYDVDYTSTIKVKEGIKSGDYDTPDDKDLLTVELHTIDIRNVYDENGDMLEPEQLKEINKEFYILN